jgi:hypothetical protein
MRNYNDPQYKLWRKSIKKRDKNTCQWPNCGSRLKVHAHHILPWSQYPGLRYHLSNGICLCKKHHDFIKNDETSYANFFLKLLYNRNI